MKKVILAITTMLAAATFATAQMRPSFKIEAGANFANQTVKVGDNSGQDDMLIGYRVGAGVEFGIMDGFYVNPGVYFLSRGSKGADESVLKALGVAANRTLWLHNVEIPVHFGYRAAIAPNMSVSVQAGPWFSYGFLGKSVFSAKGDGILADAAKKVVDELNKQDNNPYKDTTVAGTTIKAPLKPFDLGVGMQAGFEYTNFGINVGFEYGLLNTSTAENTKVNNMNFYVGLGYRF